MQPSSLTSSTPAFSAPDASLHGPGVLLQSSPSALCSPIKYTKSSKVLGGPVLLRYCVTLYSPLLASALSPLQSSAALYISTPLPLYGKPSAVASNARHTFQHAKSSEL